MNFSINNQIMKLNKKTYYILLYDNYISYYLFGYLFVVTLSPLERAMYRTYYLNNRA